MEQQEYKETRHGNIVQRHYKDGACDAGYYNDSGAFVLLHRDEGWAESFKAMGVNVGNFQQFKKI